jgi:hypothetical protein
LEVLIVKLLQKTGTRILTLALALVLALSVGAAALTPADAANRQADLDFLYSTLKSVHPDLYANTPESAFIARKAEIEKRLATESDFDFALDCASMTALVGDSHTSVSLGKSVGDIHYWLFDMDWCDGKWVLNVIDSAHKDLLGAEVTALNDLTLEQVQQKFSAFLSADNAVKLRRNFWQMCYVQEPYVYLGIAKTGEPLRVTVKTANGSAQTVSVNAVTLEERKSADVVSLEYKTSTALTAYDKTKYYFGKALNASTYYIQYNTCIEDPDLPMETFVEQVRTALKAGKYSLILVDLRNNGGGSDGLLVPLMLLLRGEMDNGVKVAGLISESTFSSALINSVELREMGCPLAGSETSGSINHFGAVHSEPLPNSGLSLNISTKYISMSGYFDAAVGAGIEPLTPDVLLPETLADQQAGRDTCVDAILANPSILKVAERNDAPLTRGRFIGQLSDGSTLTSPEEAPFADCFGIEWFLSALSWAKEQGIATGYADGSFRSAQTLSWQTAAVLMTRTVSALKLQPKTVRTTPLPAALKTASWNQSAVQSAWAWGLLPENADYAVAPTRAQGQAMASALRSL